ncbi:hypothetical protein EPA93_38840 [Ktedonosporobacter rubrisoli]|uniref:Uncharacterized protein n=1 Tax=Ktedonosporobacter rubrisoli TaxID=2509675 RepID=A0A4P6K0P2_KTERU|nr:hypothetical protein [Ktedonosporobacter rubrisoli]QBD81614.1 hypothetical protein EPA93_38840 [Ktedonosporobacter rubrisoli]
MSKDDEVPRQCAQEQARTDPRFADEQRSQVAQLRAQIDAELEAMQQGLGGLASGTARHRIISAKLRCVDHLTVHLAGHIGAEAATTTSCQAYMRVFNAEEQEASRDE